MQELSGGRIGEIFYKTGRVYRPKGFWSESVHRFLSHLVREKFHAAPNAFGFNEDGNEVLSYIPGDVYNYPLAGAIASDEALVSAAMLLRKYHAASVSFVATGQHEGLKWMLPSSEPFEVICHGDYAPYNVVLNGNQVVGMIDFDAAHPAPKIWDIAYAVYCWAPFKNKPEDKLGDFSSQCMRAKLFCDSYGVEKADRERLVDVIALRIQALIDFMLAEANNGNLSFVSDVKNGHHLSYSADIQWLEMNKNQIVEKII